jgi:hypothetical protein
MRDMLITSGDGPAVDLGDRVHYRSHGSPVGIDGTQIYQPRCRAALVSGVLSNNLLSLFVINPSGVFFDDCAYDQQMTGGTWHLPHAGAKPCD